MNWRSAKRAVLYLAVGSLTACATPVATSSPASTATHGGHSVPAPSASAPEPSVAEDPLAACEGVEPDGEPIEIDVGTVSYAFDPRIIEGPRHCQPFVVIFTNSDAPLPPGGPVTTNEHNIAIRFENLIGPLLFDGEVIGRTTIRYEVPGLPAGEHYMYCKLHAPMTGRVIVAQAGS